VKNLILVVDDDDDVRETMLMLLALEGHRAVSAENGKRALEMIVAMPESPALIFLDLWMPVMDGRGFLAARNAEVNLASIPTFLFSADSQASKIAPQLHATGYMTKPVDIKKLFAVIGEYIPGK
jgi:CheY-like chemotaxis protein